jgi:hypothetical protein
MYDKLYYKLSAVTVDMPFEWDGVRLKWAECIVWAIEKDFGAQETDLSATVVAQSVVIYIYPYIY